jgi:hypothetical protein
MHDRQRLHLPICHHHHQHHKFGIESLRSNLIAELQLRKCIFAQSTFVLTMPLLRVQASYSKMKLQHNLCLANFWFILCTQYFSAAFMLIQ